MHILTLTMSTRKLKMFEPVTAQTMFRFALSDYAVLTMHLLSLKKKTKIKHTGNFYFDEVDASIDFINII